VCFGGADFKSLSEKVVKALLTQTGIFITVVATNKEDDLKRLSNFKQQYPTRLNLLKNLEPGIMCLELQKADIGVVPSSTILMEALATGLRVFSGYFADNHLLLYKGFKNERAFYDLGDFSDVMINRLIDVVNSKEKISSLPFNDKLQFTNVSDNLLRKFRALC
jgi:spore coat polysaccharide biosynthesis predicted glycosyltransferase SpsG